MKYLISKFQVLLYAIFISWMNEWMFKDTAARKTDRLLSIIIINIIIQFHLFNYSGHQGYQRRIIESSRLA